MADFVIVEVVDGLTVVELEQGQTPEEAALGNNGMLINDEVYPSFEDARDALAEISILDEHEID